LHLQDIHSRAIGYILWYVGFNSSGGVMTHTIKLEGYTEDDFPLTVWVSPVRGKGRGLLLDYENDYVVLRPELQQKNNKGKQQCLKRN